MKLWPGLRYLLLAVAVTLLFVLLMRSDTAMLWQTLADMSLIWLVLSPLCIFINFACAARRYQALVAPDMPYKQVMEAVMASFLLNYASLVQGLGIGAKIGLMKARKVPVSRSMAGVASEVVIDFLFTAGVGLCFLLFYGAAILPEFDASRWSYLLVAVLILPLLAVALLSVRSRYLQGVNQEFRQILHSGRWHWVMLSTLGIWCSAGAGYYCLIAAVGGGEQVSVFMAFSAVCIGFIVGLVAMVPGGIGVRELTWAYLVGFGTFSIEVASVLAVLYRLLSIGLIAAILGAGRLVQNGDQDSV